ncbi:hypothetical protein PAMP_002124 [Pampus punctatissimus]
MVGQGLDTGERAKNRAGWFKTTTLPLMKALVSHCSLIAAFKADAEATVSPVLLIKEAARCPQEEARCQAFHPAFEGGHLGRDSCEVSSFRQHQCLNILQTSRNRSRRHVVEMKTRIPANTGTTASLAVRKAESDQLPGYRLHSAVPGSAYRRRKSRAHISRWHSSSVSLHAVHWEDQTLSGNEFKAQQRDPHKVLTLTSQTVLYSLHLPRRELEPWVSPSAFDELN